MAERSRSSVPEFILAFALIACTLTGCADTHRFEVDAGESKVESAQLTLHNRTSNMNVVGRVIVGERPDRADGSGWILVTFVDGSRTRCPIGYVASGDEEPRRYVIESGRCIPR